MLVLCDLLKLTPCSIIAVEYSHQYFLLVLVVSMRQKILPCWDVGSIEAVRLLSYSESLTSAYTANATHDCGE